MEITAKEISQFDYLGFYGTADCIKEGSFFITGGQMTELVVCKYDDALRAFVVTYTATANEMYRPDHTFEYEGEVFVKCVMFEYVGKQTNKFIELGNQAKKFFGDLMIEQLG